MGLVVDVYFEDGLVMDGVTIKKGMDTQIRHDMGSGAIKIDASGKITYAHFINCYSSKEKEELYTKDVLEFTGIIDTSMACLFFKEGQIQFLDISSAVGEDICDYLSHGINIYQDHPHLSHLQGKMTDADYDILTERINKIRAGDKEVPEDILALYSKRESELIDPYHDRLHIKKKFSN